MQASGAPMITLGSLIKIDNEMASAARTNAIDLSVVIQQGKSQGRYIRHETSAGHDANRGERIKNQRPSRSDLSKNLADEQKEERQRNREENNGLDSSNPFMDAKKFVTKGSGERQKRELCAQITGQVP